MSTASPTAFLLWAILSVLFLGFLVYHLWCYDRFKCLHWSSGRQPGAFKRVMTYSYLGSVPLLVLFSVAITVIKFREGFILTPDHRIIPRPLELYSPSAKAWVIPLNFVFSIAWALEMVTHLEELAFWLYLLHQNPQKEEWFSSWEYRLWYLGSMVAILGMPLTALITRKDITTCDAYIFLAGSAGSTTTTICSLYVLWRFPKFIRHVQQEGADPTVVVRLATFYQLNNARVVFRFLFTVPLMIIAIDGIIDGPHIINRSLFWTDFLHMIAGIGCFVSTTITLLIFFPRSITKEVGYRPRAPTTAANSPKSLVAVSPPYPISPQPSQFRYAHSPPPMTPVGTIGPMGGMRMSEEDEWDDESMSPSDMDHARQDGDDDMDRAPPYYAQSQPQQLQGHQLHLQYQYQYFHYPTSPPPPPTSPITTLHRYSANSQLPADAPVPSHQRVLPLEGATTTQRRHPFTHSASSPMIGELAQQQQQQQSPQSPRTPVRKGSYRHHTRRTSTLEPGEINSTTTVNRRASGGVGLGLSTPQPQQPSPDDPSAVPPEVTQNQTSHTVTPMRTIGIGQRNSLTLRAQTQPSSLHPYVMTFTSPIDLADISIPHARDEFPRTM